MINKKALEAALVRSLGLRPQESCLIVTDTIKEPIGRSFYDFARTITARAAIVVIEPTREHAAEPPADVAEKMCCFDVQLLITDRSLTHTAARRKASAKGARIATMPGITEEIINRCLDIDYKTLRRNSAHLCVLLAQTKTVRVTTALGTDISFTVGKNQFFGGEGGVFDKPGDYGNLPEGEVSFSPAHSGGVYIVDASFPDLGLVESPLAFKVKDGKVYEISGKQSSSIVKRLDQVGPAAYKIAELGIGLNPKAKIIGNILEDEKVIGTAHIAVGNNCSYGGSNDVPLHLDGVIRAPDIYIDNKKIMQRGKFISGFFPKSE